MNLGINSEWYQSIAVVVGGGLGAWSRYMISSFAQSLDLTADFPWHTFTINITGSFLLGLVVVAAKDHPNWILFLGTGLCGGFTTFSTFSLEAFRMIESDRLASASLYICGSAMAGVLAMAWAIKLCKDSL